MCYIPCSASTSTLSSAAATAAHRHQLCVAQLDQAPTAEHTLALRQATMEDVPSFEGPEGFEAVRSPLVAASSDASRPRCSTVFCLIIALLAVAVVWVGPKFEPTFLEDFESTSDDPEILELSANGHEPSVQGIEASHDNFDASLKDHGIEVVSKGQGAFSEFSETSAEGIESFREGCSPLVAASSDGSRLQSLPLVCLIAIALFFAAAAVRDRIRNWIGLFGTGFSASLLWVGDDDDDRDFPAAAESSRDAAVEFPPDVGEFPFLLLVSVLGTTVAQDCASSETANQSTCSCCRSSRSCRRRTKPAHRTTIET